MATRIQDVLAVCRKLWRNVWALRCAVTGVHSYGAVSSDLHCLWSKSVDAAFNTWTSEWNKVNSSCRAKCCSLIGCLCFPCYTLAMLLCVALVGICLLYTFSLTTKIPFQPMQCLRVHMLIHSLFQEMLLRKCCYLIEMYGCIFQIYISVHCMYNT